MTLNNLSINLDRSIQRYLWINHHRFTKDGDQSGLRIDLSKNFRSRKEVLATTNYLFDHMMDEEVGEIETMPMRDFILVLLNILINLCLLNYMH